MTTIDMRIKSQKLYDSVMKNRHTRFQAIK